MHSASSEVARWAPRGTEQRDHGRSRKHRRGAGASNGLALAEAKARRARGGPQNRLASAAPRVPLEKDPGAMILARLKALARPLERVNRAFVTPSRDREDMLRLAPCFAALLLSVCPGFLSSPSFAASSLVDCASSVDCGPILFTCGGQQCSWSLEVCCDGEDPCICDITFKVRCGGSTTTLLGNAKCNSSDKKKNSQCGATVEPIAGQAWGSLSSCAQVTFS